MGYCLHCGRGLRGSRIEFAARALSVFLGTLGVPLVLQLGRAVTKRRTAGLGAALVYATLPIFVYYSQEVRMYALATPLAAAFLWAGWRLVAGRRVGAAYVALGLLMLAAHPYTALTWLVSLVWGTLTVGLNRNRRRRRGWWKANLVLVALATPIGLWALWRVRVDATAVSAIPVAALRWLPTLYGVGQYLEQPWSGLFVAIAALSLIVTMIRAAQETHDGDGQQQGRWHELAWFLISLTLPIVALFGLTLIKAKWSERYLLPSWGLALAIAVGTAWEHLAGVQHRVTGREPGSRARGPRAWLARAAALTLILGWLALATVATGRQAEGSWALAIRDEWHPGPTSGEWRAPSRRMTPPVTRSSWSADTRRRRWTSTTGGCGSLRPADRQPDPGHLTGAEHRRPANPGGEGAPG